MIIFKRELEKALNRGNDSPHRKKAGLLVYITDDPIHALQCIEYSVYNDKLYARIKKIEKQKNFVEWKTPAIIAIMKMMKRQHKIEQLLKE